MTRFAPNWGTLAIIIIGCTSLAVVQIAGAESVNIGEVVWSGTCEPNSVSNDQLLVKCGENNPLSIGKALTAAYADAAITGAQPKTLTCDIRVTPILNVRYLDCATFIDESGSSEEL